MELKAKKVVISGQFTEEDWAELCHTIRRIERRHPDVTYLLEIPYDEANGMKGITTEEMLAAMQRTFPRVPGEEPFFGVIKKEQH